MLLTMVNLSHQILTRCIRSTRVAVILSFCFPAHMSGCSCPCFLIGVFCLFRQHFLSSPNQTFLHFGRGSRLINENMRAYTTLLTCGTFFVWSHNWVWLIRNELADRAAKAAELWGRGDLCSEWDLYSSREACDVNVTILLMDEIFTE